MEGTNKNDHPVRIDIHCAILAELNRRSPAKVISTNAIVAEIKKADDDIDLPDEELARLVTETAAFMGVIPVYDPMRSQQQ